MPWIPSTVIAETGEWQTWSPSYVGFSTPPSGGISRFCLIGKICFLLHTRSPGTSNATTFTMTLPFAAASTYYAHGRVLNNGTLGATAGLLIVFGTTNTVVDLYRDGAQLAWTASGSKNMEFSLFYEVA